MNEIIDIDIAKFVEEGLKRLEKEDEEADYIPKEFDDFDVPRMTFLRFVKRVREESGFVKKERRISQKII